MHLHEFFVEGGDRERSHVLLHITEPSTETEKARGYFFAICELNNAAARHIIKLQSLIDEVENRYYEAEEKPDEHVLEEILKQANQEGLILTKPPLQLHCVLGAIRQNEILLAFRGRPLILLFYQGRNGLYRQIDLAQTEDGQFPEAADTSLFTQVVQGKISERDFLFIGTPKVLDYFNQDRLQKIITTRPAKQSAEHLRRVLSELKNSWSFGGLLMQMESAARAQLTAANARPAVAPGGSEKSLRGLFATEKNTAHTLSPALWPKLTEKMKNVLTVQEQTTDAAHETAPVERSAQTQITSAHLHTHRPTAAKTAGPSAWWPMVKDALQMMAKIAGYLGRGIYWLLLVLFALVNNAIHLLAALFFVATDYQGRRHNILAMWSKQWQNYRNYWRQLPMLTKILVAAAILSVLTLAVGTAYLGYSRRQAQERQRFQDISQQILEKKDAAESALIYQDDTRALEELRAARNLLLGLDCQSRTHKNECQTLSRQLEELTGKVSKLTTAKPALLTDWGADGQTAPLPQRLIRIKNQLVGFASSTGTLSTYDLLTKERRVINADATNITGFEAAAVPKENDYLALITRQNDLWQYDLDNNFWKKLEISFPDPEPAIKDIVIYNRRLYSLSTTDGQIYKHDNIKTGFSLGKKWLTNELADLKTGLSLSIDGDIFIGTASGQVVKLVSGQQQSFVISGLDPVVNKIDQIWTYTDRQYLYILDTAGKRLIILNKDGRLLQQLTAKEWVGPSGMAIDEQNKQAFILDNGKLYQINLPI